MTALNTTTNVTSALEVFIAAYIRAALWSSTDESTPEGGEPMDKNYSASDIAPETMTAMRAECTAFFEAHREVITEEFCKTDDPEEQAGHDFWLTRNGHGSGFWDGDWKEPAESRLDAAAKAAGERDLYVGDDGLIYQFPA